jgi:hypothetical protein
VPDVELVVVVEFPDVGFDADAAGFEGAVEGRHAPVVVVGVAGDGADVAGEVGGVVGEAEADVAGGTPVLEDAVEWGGRDVERDMGKEDDELEDAAVESKSAVISQDCLDVSQALISYQEWTAS